METKIFDFKDLIVWQRAMDLVVKIYDMVKSLPQEERFALSDQMRRCVVSIPSNIAEGNGRTSTKEYVHFLSIAHGSATELLTQVLICRRLTLIPHAVSQPILDDIEQIRKMLISLSKTLLQKS